MVGLGFLVDEPGDLSDAVSRDNSSDCVMLARRVVAFVADDGRKGCFRNTDSRGGVYGGSGREVSRVGYGEGRCRRGEGCRRGHLLKATDRMGQMVEQHAKVAVAGNVTRPTVARRHVLWAWVRMGLGCLSQSLLDLGKDVVDSLGVEGDQAVVVEVALRGCHDCRVVINKGIP